MVKLIKMALEYDLRYTNQRLNEMEANGWEGCTLEVNNDSFAEVSEIIANRGHEIRDSRKNPFFDVTSILIRRRAQW